MKGSNTKALEIDIKFNVFLLFQIDDGDYEILDIQFLSSAFNLPLKMNTLSSVSDVR